MDVHEEAGVHPHKIYNLQDGGRPFSWTSIVVFVEVHSNVCILMCKNSTSMEILKYIFAALVDSIVNFNAETDGDPLML